MAVYSKQLHFLRNGEIRDVQLYTSLSDVVDANDINADGTTGGIKLYTSTDDVDYPYLRMMDGDTPVYAQLEELTASNTTMTGLKVSAGGTNYVVFSTPLGRKAMNASQANLIYGGADITKYFDSDAFSRDIAAGKFYVRPGDYIVKPITFSGGNLCERWIVGEINYYIGNALANVTQNHLLMIADGEVLSGVRWAGTSEYFDKYCSYKVSGPHDRISTSITPYLQDAFGQHLLTHQEKLKDSPDKCTVGNSNISQARQAPTTFYSITCRLPPMRMLEPDTNDFSTYTYSGYQRNDFDMVWEKEHYHQIAAYKLNSGLRACKNRGGHTPAYMTSSITGTIDWDDAAHTAAFCVGDINKNGVSGIAPITGTGYADMHIRPIFLLQ